MNIGGREGLGEKDRDLVRTKEVGNVACDLDLGGLVWDTVSRPHCTPSVFLYLSYPLIQ